jgi:hypothetical protein
MKVQQTGYAPYFNRTFAYEIYYYEIYFYEIYFYSFIYKQFTQAPNKIYLKHLK